MSLNIDSLNRGNSLYSQDNKLKSKYKDSSSDNSEVKAKSTSDKLEISADSLKLGPIKARVTQGFYDNPEVLKQVSQKLYNEIFDKDGDIDRK
jgi:hypothetical protein